MAPTLSPSLQNSRIFERVVKRFVTSLAAGHKMSPVSLWGPFSVWVCALVSISHLLNIGPGSASKLCVMSQIMSCRPRLLKSDHSQVHQQSDEWLQEMLLIRNAAVNQQPPCSNLIYFKEPVLFGNESSWLRPMFTAVTSSGCGKNYSWKGGSEET